jgi:hypothetical protein
MDLLIIFRGRIRLLKEMQLNKNKLEENERVLTVMPDRISY